MRIGAVWVKLPVVWFDEPRRDEVMVHMLVWQRHTTGTCPVGLSVVSGKLG